MEDVVESYGVSSVGFRIGQLVEIIGEPLEHAGLTCEIAQLLDVLPDGKLSLLTVESGEEVTLDAQHVQSASVGFDDAYDIVVGPKTGRDHLTRALADNLVEKGHCILRFIQSATDRQNVHTVFEDADAGSKFGRLAQEVEEGYVGRGGRARVMWLDGSCSSVSEEDAVAQIDAHLTYLAELMQPFSADVTGSQIEERTPSLVCSSMTLAEEMELENCSATNRELEEFYMIWKRSVLRMSHFLGPESVHVELVGKGHAVVEHLQGRSFEFEPAPNTVIIFREDVFDYYVEEPTTGRAWWLTTFVLKPMPQWEFGDKFDGDESAFQIPTTGPKAPTEDLVAVVALSIQACGGMIDHHREWAAYMGGVDGQLEMPILRFDYAPYYSDETDMPMGTTFVKHFSVQEGIELFDNKLFEISNMESEAMDPLCRQVLEVGYLSIFQLGITKKWANSHPTHASVSVGMDKQEWPNMPGVPANVATNNQLAIIANRFNYVFNLKGGSYVMDTACSSSLCAAHLGKVNLLERRWDPLEYHLGLGTGLTLTVFSFIHGSAAHMLSPDGRCLTFNASANGYNRGDGTACLMFKAGKHDDERWCYFRGSQIGQDGRSASMAAPNGPAQEKCVWGALREARMNPPDSTVWECHGTGTSLGDPIEVGAVRKVQIKMKRSEPLMIASSKSNIGHLEGSAAAIAMNKCVLVVMGTLCVATQHVRTLNPHLDHAAFDAFFATEHNPYLYNAGHCQVSSFGVGGTNGHAIFWGESTKPRIDPSKKLRLAIQKSSNCGLIVDGPDPENWEYSGPPFDLKPGEVCRVIYTKDDLTGDDEVRFERVMLAAEGGAAAVFYSTSGNHNDWCDSRMDTDESVPGLHFSEIEVPADGVLELRILADGDEDQAIGPNSTTERPSSPIIGPGPDVRTAWLVRGTPGVIVRIEFVATLSKAGQPLRSITWFDPNQM